MHENADIPAMPLNTPDDLLRDEHLAAIDFFPIVEHPSEGALRYVGVPVVMSRTPAPTPAPAPRLGEHSQAVLGEAGYSISEIEALIASGATRVPDGLCSTR
jgi:crotonobetainyl-CoA:carnitine CoA-transferase CaiB-like acyl-CoA transferase